MIATKTPAIDKAARIFHFMPGKALPPTVKFTRMSDCLKHHLGPACQPDHACLSETKKCRYYLGLIFYELGNKAIQDFVFVNWLKSHSFFSVTGPVLPPSGRSGWFHRHLSGEKRKPDAIIVRSWTGKRLSLHSSSLGKCCWPGFRKTTLMLFYPQNPSCVYCPDNYNT